MTVARLAMSMSLIGLLIAGCATSDNGPEVQTLPEISREERAVPSEVRATELTAEHEAEQEEGSMASAKGEGTPQSVSARACVLLSRYFRDDIRALSDPFCSDPNSRLDSDYVASATMYRPAIAGDPNAQYQLALCCLKKGDALRMVEWFEKAAAQGHVKAAYALGLRYDLGAGVPRDVSKADVWFRQAAEQGHMPSQRAMGASESVRHNDKESVKWFAKAAEQGDDFSQLALGEAYYKGRGVVEDFVEAYKWFLLAETNGGWATRKEVLRKEMTPAQVAEAQQAAKAFFSAQQRRSGEGQQDPAAVARSASGFCVTPAGYVLTARHAIEKATRVEVTQNDRVYPAKVVLQDGSTDAAVLKIEGSGFPCLPLVASAAVKAGDSVFTMGFPQVQVQGTEAKYTEGSISALSGVGGSPRFFQISVPIQPGNSGGPLINEKGEVVGLIVSRLDDVAALVSTGTVPQTVNYALKSSFILPLIESVPDLAEKLPKSTLVKDRSAAIENARKAVVLIVGYSDGGNPRGSSAP